MKTYYYSRSPGLALLLPVHLALCMHVCMLSHFSCVHLFAAFQTVAHQAPLSMEFSRQEYWSGVPCPLPGDLPDSGVQSESPAYPALQVDSLPTEAWGKPFLLVTGFNLLTKAVVIYVPKGYMSIIFIYCNIFAWDEDNTGLGASQMALVVKNPPVNAGDVRDTG